MTLKLLHTGDIHIGMKFNRYPDGVREELKEARINILKKLVQQANDENCNIFVVAGDLFDKISNIPKQDIVKVINILDDFQGECVLVLPGNHDYDNGMTSLWTTFKDNITDKIVLLNENRPYDLMDYDVPAIVYPAFCNSKHSSENNLSWIKNIEDKPDGRWHIGVGHGALQGLSPDLENKYFNMTENELDGINLDLWLLGHTHIAYPRVTGATNHRIFNAGTPEPDGMDCKHGGSAWIISVDEEGKVNPKMIETGIFRFYDLEFKVEEEKDFDKIKKELLSEGHPNSLIRLKLQGRIEEDLFEYRKSFYDELRKELKYLDVDDTNLGVIISKDLIENEFTKGSFPYQFLESLSEDDSDEEALQLAYELIMEVKE